MSSGVRERFEKLVSDWQQVAPLGAGSDFDPVVSMARALVAKEAGEDFVVVLPDVDNLLRGRQRGDILTAKEIMAMNEDGFTGLIAKRAIQTKKRYVRRCKAEELQGKIDSIQPAKDHYEAAVNASARTVVAVAAAEAALRAAKDAQVQAEIDARQAEVALTEILEKAGY